MGVSDLEIIFLIKIRNNGKQVKTDKLIILGDLGSNHGINNARNAGPPIPAEMGKFCVLRYDNPGYFHTTVVKQLE